MREVFDESSFINTFLNVEAALARAEATVGVIPESAAKEISEKASLEYIDMGDIEKNIEDIGLFTMSIIDAWEESLDGAGEYIHWGVTSMDISDTTLILQIEKAFDLLKSALQNVRKHLATLADAHRDTPMMGRTHTVHAIPTTAGLKFATWLDEVERHLERFDDLGDRLFVLECFGATGTMASLGEVGLEVQRNMAEELGLTVPDTAWFAARDRFVEFLQLLAAVGGTLSKICNQLLVLNRPEIGEVSEPIPEDTVGSSTMPHKRNPERTEFTIALNRLVRANATIMTEGLEANDERDWSLFPEFIVLPTSCLYSHRMLQNVEAVLDGLTIHKDKMKSNMDLYGPLIASERVMMALAESLGRQTAHDIVYNHAVTAYKNDEQFITRLKNDDRVTSQLSPSDLDELTDSENYTGLATTFVDRTLGE